MKGVAISLYDKFEDLEILVDIIRHNWDSDIFISVCSNHPRAESKIESAGIDVDRLQEGAQIRYNSELPEMRGRNNLHFRIYDNMRTSCRPIIENPDVDYFVHLHADAWQLTESSFSSIIEELRKEESAVAFPADTEMFHDNYPPGFIEDQFIYFDNTKARNVDLFERNPLEFPPMSIHHLLAIILVGKFGWGKLYQYTNGSERIHWDGRSSPGIARPMIYHPKYDQLHLATEDFEGSLGKELQAHYLSKKEVNSGPKIEQMLGEYTRPEDELFEDVDAYFDSLTKQLPIGVSVRTFDRDVREIRKYIECKSRATKLKILMRQYQENNFYPLILGVYETCQRLIGSNDSISDFEPDSDRIINYIFQNNLNEGDFPEDFQEIYHKSFVKD